MNPIWKQALAFTLAIILVLGAVLAGGCTDEKEKSAPTNTESTPSPSIPPIVYTIADPTGDWGFPSPYAHYSRGPGYTRMQFIFETLVWKDASGFVPQLARKWEYLPEENAYLFELQTEARWHDGTPFTADDVIFTFEYTRSHPYQWVDPSIISSAEALDTHTVKLTLAKPYAPFLNDYAATQPILPKHIWESVTDPEKFTAPQAVIGTGPFLLADYNRELGTYRYTANPDYYLGTPAVSEIRFVKVADQMVPAALKEGLVRAADIPAEVVSEMESGGFTILTAPVAWNAKLTMNHHKEPLSIKEFRQALAYAIDRQAIVEITQRGQAIAGSPGFVPPTSDWYNPDTPQYLYDPAKAQTLISELGYARKGKRFMKDGQALTLELIAPADFQEVGQMIADQLGKIGIGVNFRTLEAKTVDARVGAWDFDLSIYGHGGLYEPSFLNKSILGEGFNSARYTANTELTALIKGQLSEMNPAKRREMIYQIQVLYAEDMPALTLYYPKWYWAHDGTVALFYTKDGIATGVPIPLNRKCFVK